jgi:hypothetical protein
MANSQKGELDIDVDGKTYRLALDLNALCEFQELVYPGDPDFDMGETIARIGKGNFVLSRALFWATLRRHHPDVTLRDVSELCSGFGYKPWMELLPKLLDFMQPDAIDRQALKAAPEAGPRGAQVDGIGARSISRRAKSA